MRCPFCETKKTRVMQSFGWNQEVIRRRYCSGCYRVWYTRETYNKNDQAYCAQCGSEHYLIYRQRHLEEPP